MNSKDLIERTKKFSIRIIRVVENLPSSMVSKIVAGQILRSALSVSANYRAACRAKSPKDFVNKLKIVEEETDETLFWIEVIEENNLIKPEKINDLKSETKEILAIIVSSIKTARRKTN